MLKSLRSSKQYIRARTSSPPFRIIKRSFLADVKKSKRPEKPKKKMKDVSELLMMDIDKEEKRKEDRLNIYGGKHVSHEELLVMKKKEEKRQFSALVSQAKASETKSLKELATALTGEEKTVAAQYSVVAGENEKNAVSGGMRTVGLSSSAAAVAFIFWYLMFSWRQEQQELPEAHRFFSGTFGAYKKIIEKFMNHPHVKKVIKRKGYWFKPMLDPNYSIDDVSIKQLDMEGYAVQGKLLFRNGNKRHKDGSTTVQFDAVNFQVTMMKLPVIEDEEHWFQYNDPDSDYFIPDEEFVWSRRYRWVYTALSYTPGEGIRGMPPITYPGRAMSIVDKYTAEAKVNAEFAETEETKKARKQLKRLQVAKAEKEEKVRNEVTKKYSHLPAMLAAEKIEEEMKSILNDSKGHITKKKGEIQAKKLEIRSARKNEKEMKQNKRMLLQKKKKPKKYDLSEKFPEGFFEEEEKEDYQKEARKFVHPAKFSNMLAEDERPPKESDIEHISYGDEHDTEGKVPPKWLMPTKSIQMQSALE